MRVEGVGTPVEISGFAAHAARTDLCSGAGFRDQGSGFRVQGAGLRVEG